MLPIKVKLDMKVAWIHSLVSKSGAKSNVYSLFPAICGPATPHTESK